MAAILLVEDEPSNRDIIVYWLTREGHQVSVAIDGVQAVTMARKLHPDLIVMDLGLPILNGWQAIQRLKTLPDTHSIPIIALTAYVMSEERELAMAAGCDEYETKPVDFSSLLEKLNMLLARTQVNKSDSQDA
ncbi:MAG: response regulator [Chloroflexales bacterium]|nr:response regulator [Chloroflexales bacterium]